MRAQGWRTRGRAARRGTAATVVVLGLGVTACSTESGMSQTPAEQTPTAAADQGSSSSSSGSTDSTSTLGSAGTAVDWTSVAEEASASVVSILVEGPAGSAQGSGVVIDEEGHVLTNAHVVADAGSGGSLQVVLTDATVLEAELVGSDPATDLAVLSLDPPPAVSPIELGDSTSLRVGQPVMALGNPLGLSNTSTVGIVSALDRPVTTAAESTAEGGLAPTPVVTNAIQTDAAVNPGNSGGALVDAEGRLVGVNSSIATVGGSDGNQTGSIGLGFAIPVAEAGWVAQALIEDGRVQHSYLGVTPQDAVVEVDGVRRQAAGIVEVAPGTPAGRAGLRAGDAITEVDGEAVPDALSLVAQVREREPGTEVLLGVVEEGGGTEEVTVVFGVRPD
ncbi:MAG: hypothetical protein JWN84_2231 [Nocardioides sp.]|nr:hypothetical protein [Nocardioides sp.]